MLVNANISRHSKCLYTHVWRTSARVAEKFGLLFSHTDRWCSFLPFSWIKFRLNGLKQNTHFYTIVLTKTDLVFSFGVKLIISLCSRIPFDKKTNLALLCCTWPGAVYFCFWEGVCLYKINNWDFFLVPIIPNSFWTLTWKPSSVPNYDFCYQLITSLFSAPLAGHFCLSRFASNRSW